MANSHFCLSSDTYKNHVFEGFKRLQQSDEFVDMTLAAGDQYVTVHKTLIVLASPYLKKLLQTVPCQHPVLLLSNVNSEELRLILEYIYTGEVKVSPEKIEAFLNAARAMHISGLENILLPAEKNPNKPRNKPKKEKKSAPLQPFQYTKSFPAVKANIIISENDFNLQVEPQVEPNTQVPDVQNDGGNNFPLLDFNNEAAPERNLCDFVTGVGTKNIEINLDSDDDNGNNENLNLDNMNNVVIANTPVTSENIDIMPIVVDEMPQDLQRPFLNIGKAAFTIKNTAFNITRNDITVDSTSIPNPTSNGNIINVASKSSIAENGGVENGLNNLDWDIASHGTAQSNAVNQEQANEAESASTSKEKDSMLYTISSRGSLQLIMNRFLYYSHYTRDGGRKRRWRCIEYRDKHCPAAIDTDGETIVARKNKHAHPNHDKKIWNKVVKSRVFPSIKMGQDAVNEKQTLSKPVPEEVVVSD